MYQQVPYQETIGQWSMKYQTQYQGNISPRNMKYGRLYQGSIKREDFQPKVYGKFADRNNAYKYYQLPPDYYGVRRRHRVTPPSPLQTNNRQETRDSVHNQQTLKPRTQNEGREQVLDPPVPENVNRDVTDKRKQKVKELARLPVTAVAPVKQPQKHKPVAQPRKPPDPVSPFPPASPEPHKPANRRDIKITPEPIRVRSFTDVAKPQPVFPPIMPVTMEDYVKTEHTRKVTPPRIRRNPFLPIVRPTEDSAMVNLLRYSRISPINSERRDSYHDSLTRSFTNVPGYNAVGSVLRSLHIYNH